MGRRNEHSREELRELALQAAIQIINEQGLSGLSTRKIATAIGYTVGSLYLVFKNLDDLVLQINARTLDELYTVINRTARQHEPPEQCLLALGHTYFQFVMDQPQRWRMLFEYHRSQRTPLPSWYQKKIARLFNLVEKPLQKILRAPHIQACVKDARALWGSVHGICILADKLEVVGVHSIPQLLELLITTYLAGLKEREQK